MIDLQGLPMPEDAPAPGRCVRVERPEPGLVVLVLDPPHRELAVLDVPLVRDLWEVLEGIEQDPQLRGLVIRGREPGRFAAGADVKAIEALTDAALVERVVRLGQELFQRIHRLARRKRRPVLTVAAVGGPVPGGAYELALACSRIVAADLPSTRIGLPETQLGIVPAWGGSQRLPRRVGVPAALPLILQGTLLPARAAHAKGLVDRVTPPESLYEVAAGVALGKLACPRRGRRGPARWLVDRNPLAAWFIERQALRAVERQSGGHYPALPAAVSLVSWAPLKPLKVGLDDEARHGAQLAVTAVCKNLIGVFHLREAARRLGKGEGGAAPAPFERALVLGGGVMGGGIASLLAEKGIPVRLFDVAQKALDTALYAHRRRLARLVKRRRIEPHEQRAALDRLDPTAELVGLSRVDLVIEAVAERLDVKRDVLGRVAALARPHAVLATNTSSLSVDAIAEGLLEPRRVAGLHFFNPVDRMPLVEVVRGPRTDPATLTRLAALALALGKTPVLVADVAGFLVNRLLGPYLDEALRLYVAGVDPLRLDGALERFGMPMGPLALLDEVGLDVATHAARSLHAAYGVRMTPSDALVELVRNEHLGKKTGRGFYVHAKGGRRGHGREVNPELARLAPQRSNDCRLLEDHAIAERVVLAMIAEAVRALDERVVETPGELDLATVFGMGFAPFRGGLLRHADTLGLPHVVERLRHTAQALDVAPRPGGPERFEPPALLVRLAEQGGRLRG